MQVEVQEAPAAFGHAREPIGSVDLVQAIVEVGQQAHVGAELPRRAHHGVEHQGAVDAFHHDLGPVRAHLLDVRYRVTLIGHVAHDARLVRDRPAAARLAQHEAGREFEDVAVASAGEQLHQTMRLVLSPQ